MTIGIYCIEHVESSKRYIGKSKNVERRLKEHMHWLTKGTENKIKVSRHLYNAVKKYGIEAFKFSVIETFNTLNEVELSDRELYWMDTFSTLDRKHGYNLVRDSSTGSTHHVETIVRMSESNRGDKNPNFGNFWTDEQKAIMSEDAKRRHAKGNYGDEWRAKLSAAGKETWKDENKLSAMADKVASITSKHVFKQFTQDGELVAEYGSIREILQANPTFKRQGIYKTCRAERKTYNGYKWSKVVKI